LGYLAVWKVLEEMITDLKKRGGKVTTEVMRDLKSAKTSIRILQADPSRLEYAQRVEEYLTQVESYLVSEGQKAFGKPYVDRWLEKRDEAGRKTDEKEESREIKFTPGLTRGQKWIRMNPSKELPVKEIEALADELNLTHRIQADGFITILGSNDALKNLVKKIAAKPKTKSASEH
jgi:hypothetical protein